MVYSQEHRYSLPEDSILKEEAIDSAITIVNELIEKEKGRKISSLRLSRRVRGIVLALSLGVTGILSPHYSSRAEERESFSQGQETPEVLETPPHLYIPIILNGADIRNSPPVGTVKPPTNTPPPGTEPPTATPPQRTETPPPPSLTITPTVEPTRTELPVKKEILLPENVAVVQYLDPNTTWWEARQITRDKPVTVEGSYRTENETFHRVTTKDGISGFVLDSEVSIPQDEQQEYQQPLEKRMVVMVAEDHSLELIGDHESCRSFPPCEIIMTLPLTTLIAEKNQTVEFRFKGQFKNEAKPDGIDGTPYNELTIYPYVGETENYGFIKPIVFAAKNGQFLLQNGRLSDNSVTRTQHLAPFGNGQFDILLELNSQHTQITAKHKVGDEYVPFVEEDGTEIQPFAFDKPFEMANINVFIGSLFNSATLKYASATFATLPQQVNREALNIESQIESGIFSKTGQIIGTSLASHYDFIMSHGGFQYLDSQGYGKPRGHLTRDRVTPYNEEKKMFELVKRFGLNTNAPIYLDTDSAPSPSYNIPPNLIKDHMDYMLSLGAEFPVIITGFNQKGQLTLDPAYQYIFADPDGSLPSSTDILIRAVKYANSQNQSEKWRDLGTGEKVPRPVNIALHYATEPGAFSKIFSVIDKVVATGGVFNTIEVDISRFNYREAQQLALMIKNRGLKLRPTNIHDNVLTIDQQVQICKEIGGCEVMILKILTFPGDDQSEMIIFGNEIGELTYNRDNLNRFLKALNVR